MAEKYIVLDPGFEHQDSHHQVVNSLISSGCQECDELIIVAGKHYSGGHFGQAKVLSYFDLNMYPVGYHDLGPDEYEVIVEDFYQHFCDLFKMLELNVGEKIIIHTAFSYVYEGLARALYHYGVSGIDVYISTMFSPGRIVEFGEAKTQSLREYMRHKFAFGIFKKLENERRFCFRIESPTQLYLDAYQMLWPEKQMNLHPSVCGGGKNISNGKKQRVLTYLGGPKWDKGIEFTIDAICKLSEACKNYEFVFHYNDEFPGSDVYLPLVNKLVALNDKNIQVINGNLDKKAYENLLASASCYFLLYDPEYYQYKTSGVLWDTLRHAQDKSIVVCNNTWHAKELTQIGANFNAVDYGDSDALVRLLKSNHLNVITPKIYNNIYVKTLLDDFGKHLFKALNLSEKTSENSIFEAKKKILVVRTAYGHFTKLSGPGGFVEYLPEYGFDVEEVLIPLGHQETPFRNDGKRWDLLNTANQYIKSYQVNAFQTEQEILAQYHSYDVVHFVDGEHAGLMIALAKLNGAVKNGPKLVATFHQPDYVIKELIIDASFLKGFDTIQLMSPCQKQSFLDLGVEESKLVVVPHGVAHEHFMPSLPVDVADAALEEIDQLQTKFAGRKIIITVGNWLRDYDMFLEVARSFKAQNDIVFVAVSRGLELVLGNDDENILLLNSGISDRALHWLYRRCELMFLPLKGGAANNAILEAVAASTTIVTSDLPSTRYYTNNAAKFCNFKTQFVDEINLLTSEDEHCEYLVDFSWSKVTSLHNLKLYSNV
ncbi:glycosyltransferase family 4 protein [Shewanella metallivivens]|uniref:Glycosyltransferase n=1 Tax=Shewanella metallivivens TaxID=2872342 RepID=A0ABT5TL52_9GAMM|nr:glycosyltransferase [Shewanella metallivivens]MDD8059332.1 glycosyltransferase [Shewanella metallivivens]